MSPLPSQKPLTSALAGPIASYLRLKEALGCQYTVERAILYALDRFLTDTHADLTADTFQAWHVTLARLSSGVRRNRLRVVRNLCLYRRRTCATAFVPDPAGFPTAHTPAPPHIFTDAEIVRLLRAVAQLRPTSVSPIRQTVFRLALVLLYTTGLRRGELLRLTVGDYHVDEHLLLVRECLHRSLLISHLHLHSIVGETTGLAAPLWSGSVTDTITYRDLQPRTEGCSEANPDPSAL
jgi:integrase